MSQQQLITDLTHLSLSTMLYNEDGQLIATPETEAIRKVINLIENK